jgi:hypothetical protein
VTVGYSQQPRARFILAVSVVQLREIVEKLAHAAKRVRDVVIPAAHVLKMTGCSKRRRKLLSPHRAVWEHEQ